MARYSKEKEKQFLERIRSLIVKQSDLTILEVQAILEKDGRDPLHLDKNYINKLINKIRKGRAERMNHATVNYYLGKFEDEVDSVKKKLWAIIQNPETFNKDKISAIRELRNSSVDLFDKMFDAGVFEKKLGVLKVQDVLSEEESAAITKSLEHALKPTDPTLGDLTKKG